MILRHPHLEANCLILSEMSIRLNVFRSPTNSPAIWFLPEQDPCR
jgi:hypothetical protein